MEFEELFDSGMLGMKHLRIFSKVIANLEIKKNSIWLGNACWILNFKSEDERVFEHEVLEWALKVFKIVVMVH